MNKRWVGFHLGEALEELQRLTVELDEPEFDEVDLKIGLEHAYHHINTAWNSRNTSDEDAASETEEDFYRDRQFPRDIDLGSP